MDLAGLGSAAAVVLPSSTLRALVCIVIVAIAYPELRRCVLGAGRERKTILTRYSPEAAGLVVCAAILAYFRLQGRTPKDDPAEEQAWAQIAKEWPLLLTADSLLSVQGVLRVVAYLSVALRDEGRSDSGACGLLLLAILCRLSANAYTSVYRLDGPLGGTLATSFEVALVPLLAALSRRAISKVPARFATLLGAMLWVGYRNRLALSGPFQGDVLWIAAHCLEILSALAHLVRTAIEASQGCGAAAGMLHLLLPTQAALAVYFFHEAFKYDKDLVGAGRPFVILHYGTVVQLGAYCAACALYLTQGSNEARARVAR